MRAELRPSSLGEILDRTAHMYRSHFLLYFGIAAISYSGVLVLTLLGDLALFSRHLSAQRLNGLSALVTVAAGLIAFLPIAVAMAAIMGAVARNYLGEATTIRQAYANIGRLWYRYVLILLAMDCYAVLPVLLLFAAVGLTAVLTPVGFVRNLFIGLMVVLIFAAMIFACWCFLRWLLAVPASLMENLKVHRALKRSALLTVGARGRIFVMLLLVGAIMAGVQYAIQIPMFLLLFKSKGVPTLATQVLSAFGGFLSGSFVMPVYSIALTLFYYDQRIRKEGYDVEWLLEQAANAGSSQTSHEATVGSPLPANPLTQAAPIGPASPDSGVSGSVF